RASRTKRVPDGAPDVPGSAGGEVASGVSSLPSTAPAISAVPAGSVAAPNAAEVPWLQAGVCGRRVKANAWTDYLAGFRRIEGKAHEIFIDDALHGRSFDFLEVQVTLARSDARAGTGLDAAPPAVYVHASLEAMREHACVNEG